MKIGKLEFQKPLALAPMEDVTTSHFRRICRKLGADIVYTEFTSSEAIIRYVKKALKKISISKEEHPIGIQLFGGVETSMKNACQIAESLKPDLIDINCGCWVKNHALRGEGSGLLRDLKKLESIVKTTVRSTRLPVTVKTRLGWDVKNIVIMNVAKIVEQCGAKVLTIHCRTRSQGYKGRADWSWLENVKKGVSIPIFGNGDVISAQDVRRMFETGCDGIMIGRGALANPWIFKQAKHYLKTGQELPLPSITERIELCLKHLKLVVAENPSVHGLKTFRKYYPGYIGGLPHAAKLRSELMQMTHLDQIEDRLWQFAKKH